MYVCMKVNVIIDCVITQNVQKIRIFVITNSLTASDASFCQIRLGFADSMNSTSPPAQSTHNFTVTHIHTYYMLTKNESGSEKMLLTNLFRIP